jgi:hypothetical protein
MTKQHREYQKRTQRTRDSLSEFPIAAPTKCAKNMQTRRKQKQAKWEKEGERRGGKGRGRKTREKGEESENKIFSPL